jgi:PAS domain S-box-containing protein
MVTHKHRNWLSAKLRDIPLRYRLSIPFFLLAFLGTFSLDLLALLSSKEIIQQEEQERLSGYNRALLYNMESQGKWAVSLASSFGRNPEIAAAMAAKDRLRLIDLCYPAYIFMKERFGISQFNFHTVPPRNFLRLQRLYEFGDTLNYRQTIFDAISKGTETFGLETGLTGHGIRGVAPIYHEGQMVGTVEIGFNFGSFFLEKLKDQFGVQASFLYPYDDGTGFYSFATTFPENFERVDPVYAEVFKDRSPRFLSREISGIPYALLLGTVQDYQGKTIALVEFCVDRTQTLKVMDYYRNLMLSLGILGMVLSVGAIYLLSAYFTRPIREMVTFARDIAQGQFVRSLKVSPSGELRVLANALEEMLVSLKLSQAKIQDYTDNLERMVHLRTRALRESEEKYRTLVENVPLAVYRLLGNGKTIFINHFIEEIMGVPIRTVLDSPDFWKEKVWEEDRPRVWAAMDRCLQEGQEFKAEYRITHANGKLIYVLDHALPVFDEKGNVETVDGYLVNVTDRYCLHKQIIQTEELRTLSEVSARLAHEIRNPLVAAGGFARRLLHTLPEKDPHREKVGIIVQEVARLEKILEKTLAYLKPFEIISERFPLNDLLMQILEEHQSYFEEHSMGFELTLASDLRPISLDPVLFKTALENVLKALLNICKPESSLQVRTAPGENNVHLEMILHGVQVSEDDIDHFFYPFTSQSERSKTLDLPMAKMIIHKHQGLIRLRRKGADKLILSITLPQ